MNERIPGQSIHYCNKDESKQRAIDRANALLNTVEVYRKTNIIIG